MRSLKEDPMKKLFVPGVAVMALLAAPVFAQTGTTSQPGTARQPGTTTQSESKSSNKATTTPDEHFIREAAMGGMAEVELGKLAATKASSAEVKTFAQKMVDDHSKAGDELKTIAEKKNIAWPAALDSSHKATYDRLSKLSGAEFDKAYMSDMLKDHKMDVSAFRKESQTGKDPEVKAFASKTLPTLEDHLSSAESANRAVATSGTGKTYPKGTSGRTPETGGHTPEPGGQTPTK